MNKAQTSPRPENTLPQPQRIDGACSEFERQWRAGKRPRIEDFQNASDDHAHEHLLRELIIRELRLRHEAGDDICSEEYRCRFTRQPHVVSAAFDSFWHAYGGDSSQTPTESMGDGKASNTPPIEAAESCGATPASIGRYQIISRLGGGGFAHVYLARDTKLNRDVAIKVPRLDRLENDRALDLFIDEARKAAQLAHHGIVQIHDVQRESGYAYIVQQYMTGGDLARYMESRDVPPERAAELVTDIAEAIGYAHQRGYVHLDLKPANILMDSDGNPCVADFGVALRDDKRHSMQGEVVGTYAFMSPEQLRGDVQSVDGRTDIWGLGVILYELLTGTRPFDGKSREQLKSNILNRDPKPPRQIKPSLSPELCRICVKCLEKQISDRYPSTSDLIDELRTWHKQNISRRGGSEFNAQHLEVKDDPDVTADRKCETNDNEISRKVGCTFSVAVTVSIVCISVFVFSIGGDARKTNVPGKNSGRNLPPGIEVGDDGGPVVIDATSTIELNANKTENTDNKDNEHVDKETQP